MDLTRPWDKVTAADANLGPAATGGAAGADGPSSDSGRDVGAGGAIDSGSGAGDANGGTGGAIDAPGTDAPGGLDAGAGGSPVDGPVVSAGDAGNIDIGADVPLAGAGGGPGTGGSPGSGGSTGGGGKNKTGGASGRGGAGGGGGSTSTGGASATGGASSTGGVPGIDGATTSDADPDVGPDAQPDTSTLGTGLLAYYPCESASASSLPDVSGNGNHATLSASGSYSFAAGPKVGLGNALTLVPANSGHVAMPAAMFRGLTQMTIAIWVKVGAAVEWQRVFDIGVNAGLSQNPVTGTNTIAYMNFVAQSYQVGPALFAITKAGYTNEQELAWTAPLPLEWHHVAIVLSASSGTLYVDGASATVNTSMTLRPADLGAIDYAFIGRSQFSVDPYFDGSIDDLRVYDRALSASEIQALYALGAP